MNRCCILKATPLPETISNPEVLAPWSRRIYTKNSDLDAPCVGLTEEEERVIAAPSFSLVDDSLKKNPRGVDVDKLIAAILKAKPPVKSEFESNADFDVRMEKFSEKNFIGEVGHGRRVAVISLSTALPSTWNGSYPALDVRYDAETETMTATLNDDLSCMLGLALSRTTIPKRQYVAANGFGQKVNVTVVDVTETCLEFSEAGKVKSPKRMFKLSVGKKAAASTKGLLGIAVIGRLAPPYAQKEKSHEAPDMRYPVEKNIVRRILTLNVDTIWLINYATGDILSKDPLSIE